MNKPHKHAAIIKAWADGAEVEFLLDNGTWRHAQRPSWCAENEYRIKPKPDVVRYVCAATENMGPMTERKTCLDNLKLTFDGDTGKLKTAEVLQ